jgi:GT2 family glycosyltransferase
MISVIIPVYINKEEIYQLLSDCVASLVGADEIIIQFDRVGEGFSKTMNKGVARSHGDYIALLNDDVKMLEGSLTDFCMPNTIVRPREWVGKKAKFSFVVMPREVWDRVGGLDEDFEMGGWEDSWFMFVAIRRGVRRKHVSNKVWHKGSATTDVLRTDELDKKNMATYDKKVAEFKE